MINNLPVEFVPDPNESYKFPPAEIFIKDKKSLFEFIEDFEAKNILSFPLRVQYSLFEKEAPSKQYVLSISYVGEKPTPDTERCIDSNSSNKPIILD